MSEPPVLPVRSARQGVTLVRTRSTLPTVPPDPATLAGRIDVHTLASDTLRGNHLGDPYERPLWVQRPAGAGDEPLPTVYLLQGYFGRLEAWDDRVPFRPTVPEAIDRLAPRVTVVYVDAWTAYGGSQFVEIGAVAVADAM